MSKTRKSWQEKLDETHGLPRVEQINERLATRWGSGTLVIPAPREVDGLMRQVSSGRVTTINNIREELAQRHSATMG